MSYSSPDGDEQPTSHAELKVVTKALSLGERAALEQPTLLAELVLVTELLSPGELADIEAPTSSAKLIIQMYPMATEPTIFAELSIELEALPPWDEL